MNVYICIYIHTYTIYQKNVNTVFALDSRVINEFKIFFCFAYCILCVFNNSDFLPLELKVK